MAISIETRTVEIAEGRYAELIAKEERLRLLLATLEKEKGYTDLNPIKKIFGLNKEE